MIRTGLRFISLLLTFLVAGILYIQLSPLSGRGQEAEEPATYVGTLECVTCHQEVVPTWLKTSHSKTLRIKDLPPEKQGCEACHGPGSKHYGDPEQIINPEKLKPDKGSDICLKCHQYFLTKDQWFHTRHAKSDLSCMTCHDPHSVKYEYMLKKDEIFLCYSCHPQVKNEFLQNSKHPLKPVQTKRVGIGLMCTSCHDPMRSPFRGMTKEEKNALCITCHADKDGPFLFAHPAVFDETGDGCLSCHSPHGSTNKNLLRFTGRGLCLQCHTDRFNHRTGITCYTAGCHSQIHGSNDSILFFKKG